MPLIPTKNCKSLPFCSSIPHACQCWWTINSPKRNILNTCEIFFIRRISLSRLQFPSNIFVIWMRQVMYFHTFFFNSLTEFIQNSSCVWPNKSCNILPMSVINQILLPCRNLKFIFYKACVVVFRNRIEWAAFLPNPVKFSHFEIHRKQSQEEFWRLRWVHWKPQMN